VGVLAVLAAGLFFSGATTPAVVADPGALVRWGLPAATLIHHLAMALTWAALVFAVVVIPRPAVSGRGIPVKHPVLDRTVTIGWSAAMVWAGAGVAVLVLGYADTIGVPVSASAEFTGQLAYYLWHLGPGQARTAVVVIAAATAIMITLSRSRRVLAATAVLALAAVVPLSQLGHAAGAENHNSAVIAVALHVGGAGLWTGGVVMLALLAPLLSKPDPTRGPGASWIVLGRFSAVAGAAYAVVLVSGILNTIYRIQDWNGLESPYGTLVVLKTATTLGLGVIGYLNRRWITAPARTAAGQMRVWQLITAETLLLGAVMAMGTVLAATPPP
jgi:putative copper export protein